MTKIVIKQEIFILIVVILHSLLLIHVFLFKLIIMQIILDILITWKQNIMENIGDIYQQVKMIKDTFIQNMMVLQLLSIR